MVEVVLNHVDKLFVKRGKSVTRSYNGEFVTEPYNYRADEVWQALDKIRDELGLERY